MIELKPDECRVLGVLIEKAQTTPAQYPLSLNAVVTGCNQKNNRHPITEFDEDRTLRALDSLRSKRLVVEVNMAGSRVLKYRHETRETLDIRTPALVILAELLLRGPQTVGELRSRASRMHPFESIEAVKATLDSLAQAEAPLVRVVTGGRAIRYAQLLCPDLHPLDVDDDGEASVSGNGNTETPQRITRLETQIEHLEQQVAEANNQIAQLRDYLSTLAESLGEPGPK